MKVWLFGLSAALVFVLLNTAGSTQSPESDADFDGDGMSDAYEIFFGLTSTNSADALQDFDGDFLVNLDECKKLTDPFYWDTDRDGFNDLIDSNAVSRAYLRWGDPQFTTGDEYEYAHPDWLLGAYKNGGEWVATTQVWDVSGCGSNNVSIYSGWYVSAGESNDIASLNIDLDRSIFTNNLRYAIYYSVGRAGASRSAVLNSSLFLDLLDTNGVPIVEDLFGNLLAGSNVETAIILDIPTAQFPAAAVIQLKVCHSRESGNPVFVYEGLLYIDEDGDGLDADQERQLGTSDYFFDGNEGGISNYCDWVNGNTGSATNSPDGEDGEDDDGDDSGDEQGDKKSKIIYVHQAIGNDALTGRAPDVSANKGPKKTVRGGLSIAESADTIIIKSGTYNENLDIRGRDVKVFIEGNVRL